MFRIGFLHLKMVVLKKRVVLAATLLVATTCICGAMSINGDGDYILRGTHVLRVTHCTGAVFFSNSVPTGDLSRYTHIKGDTLHWCRFF